jgi:hypothetical protein
MLEKITKTDNMRICFVLFILLTASVSFSQMRPIDKVYIVEGIMTTSDEKGYFKLVVPVELIAKKQNIYLDIFKTGYKRNGSGFSYNPSKADSIQLDASAKMMWNYDIKIFWMAENGSQLSSTSGAYARTKEGVHSSAAVLHTFNDAVTSELKSRKMEQLKQGNEKVFFLINGKAAMATVNCDVYFDNAEPMVFVNNKRVKTAEINNRLKRNKAHVDWSKSDTLSKQYGKDAIAFTIND